jgi:hypothetical protein
MQMIDKVCEGCGTPFSVSIQYKRKRFCTEACGARIAAARNRKSDPEKTRASVQRWRENHRPEHRASSLSWYQRNREKMVAHMRAKYHARKNDDLEGLRLEARKRYEHLRQTQPWRKLIWNARTRANRRNLAFDLTLEWIEARWTGNCECSQVPFEIFGSKLFAPSIDRIDPKKGYTQNNCRVILWGINMLKAHLDDAEVYRFLSAISKYSSPP